ncbi:hypothetical protein CBL_04609 [Carabus blaptoides fortunei]
MGCSRRSSAFGGKECTAGCPAPGEIFHTAPAVTENYPQFTNATISSSQFKIWVNLESKRSNAKATMANITSRYDMGKGDKRSLTHRTDGI